MAVLAAAQLLDELMGRHRNTNPNDKTHKLNWEDPEYCVYYMVKFCPHDLFVNTRADLGVCPRIHDDEAKDLYENAEPSYKKSYYQDEFMRFCQNLINDVERKIEKGKQRLILMNSKPEAPTQTAAQSEKDQEQIKSLNEQIAAIEKEAEAAGMRGDVEQAQKIMKNCDKLKEEKDMIMKQTENNSHWNATAELAAAQEKQMEVCPVCAAFLIIGDAQQRIDDHLTGKQHVGYYKLRQAFDEMNAERAKLREEKEKRRREVREKERDRGSRFDRDRERHHRGDRREGRYHSREREDRSHKDTHVEERSRSHRSGREEKSSGRHDKDKERKHKEKGGHEHSRERHDSGRRHRSRSRGRNSR